MRFRRANADQDVRVVILTGAGETAFCTGSDLKKTMPPKESFAELTFGRPKWLYPFAGMEIDKPMICAVNGFALAGRNGIGVGLRHSHRILQGPIRPVRSVRRQHSGRRRYATPARG